MVKTVKILKEKRVRLVMPLPLLCLMYPGGHPSQWPLRWSQGCDHQAFRARVSDFDF